jgi:hypothetical protein
MLTSGNEEKDKGKEFEGSWCRVLFLMVITYGILYGYMTGIKVNNPALNAVIPALGFNISTWSIPYVKIVWLFIKDHACKAKVKSNIETSSTVRRLSTDLCVEVTDDTV